MYFLANWSKDKARTWSGTCWGLFHALMKYYDVKDINVNRKKSLVERILRKISIIKSDMDLNDIITIRKQLMPKFSICEESLIFQFKEYIPTTVHIKSFIYQDLTVSYVKYMATHLPELFKISGFQYFTLDAIERKLALEREYQQSCTGIFCMGEWLRKYLIDTIGIASNRVHAVGGGVNLNINKLSSSMKRGNKILFVGRDFIRKGGYLTYEAFCELKRQKPDCELYVAGPASNPIKSPINGYHFLGDCNSDILAYYFNLCDIFCMPSYFEAYGLVFIEALTYGLPCIGRNCYEMPYFIQDGVTGFLIDEDNPLLLANRMLQLLENETIKQNVLARREWYVQNYSWDAVAQRILQVISN